ncbi:MAG: CpsD/CapB family tyrosine-protein kinase [Bacillota bacterium]|nr:CpsD/CapB family tyrosine-protein kinase [Bacillota bacterium]
MLIVQDKPKSPISEAYRTLRSNIQFSSFDKELKIILVTSSGPSEGKSTTTANLALAMAEVNQRVLLIDCDLRKSTVHKKFNITNTKGISNLLIGQYKFDDVAQKYTENLTILTAGTVPPNPSEMLASNKMKSFLAQARENFDYIIIDAPPVIAVTDPQVLSTMVDGVLLVVASGQAQIEETKKAVELLQQVNAPIIGTVLNKVEKTGRKGYYGNYYYYYGDSEEKNKKK